VAAHDVDGAGVDEVLAGDAQWGDVRVLAGESGAELWSFANPEHGTTAIAAGDADADGTVEIFFGSGFTSSGPDALFAVDSGTHLAEWTSRGFGGPVRDLAAGDLEGDGRLELLAGGTIDWGEYSDGILYAFDAYTERRVEAGLGPPGGPPELAAVRAANLDVDAPEELCVGINGGSSGRVACLDGADWSEEWALWLPDGLAVASLEIADVDDDGALELVVGTRRESTDADGAYVFLLRGDNGWLEWRSEDLNVHWSALSYLRVGELDGDDEREIVVGDVDQRLAVLAGSDGRTSGGPWEIAPTALEVGDLDGEGFDEIYVGVEGAEIRRVDAADGTTALLFATEGTVTSLCAAEIDGAPGPEIVYVSGGRARIRRPADGETLWSSEDLGAAAGADDALLVADLDHDRAPDLAVGTPIGFVVFASSAGEAPLFLDGFESGDTGGWSSTASP
jgi:hypothetical protein